jgi:hypothetical protein
MIVVTLDIDWAPDHVIRYVARMLLDNSVHATWFVTHDSDAVRELFNHKDIFEFGIHPNFDENSTQGSDHDSIIKNLLDIVPDVKLVRTHGLIQSTNTMQKLAAYGLQVDLSIYLPKAKHVEPFNLYFAKGERIIRHPFVWEDDLEMCCPNTRYEIGDDAYAKDVRIYNFHPIHVYLNSSSIDDYMQYKERGNLKYPEPAEENRNGIRSVFCECINHMKKYGSSRVIDLLTDFKIR